MPEKYMSNRISMRCFPHVQTSQVRLASRSPFREPVSNDKTLLNAGREYRPLAILQTRLRSRTSSI
jgi:hypothetical protein